MIAESKPDCVIYDNGRDAPPLHHSGNGTGLRRDYRKPMTTDLDKLKAIFETIDRSGRSLRVTFNYRYAPAYTRFRELVMQGVVGRPPCRRLFVAARHQSRCRLFRRHREKQNSGGLIVHKATHHFDLVNWWIDSYPQQVFAMGSVQFYGRENAVARGESYSYTRYTGVPEARNDPFALFLDEKADYQGLYLDAEAETGYIRDRNVLANLSPPKIRSA